MKDVRLGIIQVGEGVAAVDGHVRDIPGHGTLYFGAVQDGRVHRGARARVFRGAECIAAEVVIPVLARKIPMRTKFEPKVELGVLRDVVFASTFELQPDDRVELYWADPLVVDVTKQVGAFDVLDVQAHEVMGLRLQVGVRAGELASGALVGLQRQGRFLDQPWRLANVQVLDGYAAKATAGQRADCLVGFQGSTPPQRGDLLIASAEPLRPRERRGQAGIVSSVSRLPDGSAVLSASAVDHELRGLVGSDIQVGMRVRVRRGFDEKMRQLTMIGEGQIASIVAGDQQLQRSSMSASVSFSIGAVDVRAGDFVETYELIDEHGLSLADNGARVDLAPAPTLAPAPATARGPAEARTASVDVATATPQQLATLPGMNPERVQRIVAARAQGATFADVTDFAVAAGLAPHEVVRLARHAHCSSASATISKPVDTGVRQLDF